MKKRMMLSVLVLLILNSSLQAKDSTTCTGLLLKQPMDVISMSMGGAYAAVQTTAIGSHDYNPAGLAGIDLTRYSATYLSGLVDDNFGALAFDMPLYDKWSIGSSLIYFDAGQMDINSLDGDTTQVTAQRDFLLSAILARRQVILGSDLDLGANVKLLYSTLVDEYTAIGVAVDLGVRYEIKPLLEGLAIGAAIKNIGPTMSYNESADELPGYAIAGLAFSMVPINSLAFMVTSDLHYDLEEKVQNHFGLELTLFDIVSLRGGYKAGYDLGAITAGLGIEYNQFELNYGFNLMEVVNSTHRINLVYTMKSLESEKAKEKVKEETIDDMLDAMNVRSGANNVPTEKIQVKVLEVRRKGGQASVVVLGVGINHGMKENYRGTLYDANNKPVAGIILTTVEAELSLAQIQGLSKDIDNRIWAIIEKPKTESSKQGGNQ